MSVKKKGYDISDFILMVAVVALASYIFWLVFDSLLVAIIVAVVSWLLLWGLLNYLNYGKFNPFYRARDR